MILLCPGVNLSVAKRVPTLRSTTVTGVSRNASIFRSDELNAQLRSIFDIVHFAHSTPPSPAFQTCLPYYSLSLIFILGCLELRPRYIQAEEANLPETMCRLTVGMRSVEELRALTLKAKDLMLNTPKSFRKILRSALYANLSQVACFSFCPSLRTRVFSPQDARCREPLSAFGLQWQ